MLRPSRRANTCFVESPELGHEQLIFEDLVSAFPNAP
jgi:hypothetical protein